jgi:phosphatidylserine decarboxylase
LLGKDSAYRDAFADGVLTHTFLDVEDYHRYHFPVGGTIKEVNIIFQDDAVGGTISWSPDKNKYLLDSETPGWQFIETRGYVIIQTGKYGLVAVMPVGMSQVSSVNFEANVQVGSSFKKGDMLGYFLFGGSDCVILFQKAAGFKITASGNEKDGYRHVFMGETFGVLNGTN